MSVTAAPCADVGGVATLGAAPSRIFLRFVFPIHVSAYDQKYILTCQV